jgi:hypothetical protein
MEDAILLSAAAAAQLRLRLLALPRVTKAFYYAVFRRGEKKGYRVFAVGLHPEYGMTHKPVTEDEAVKLLA